MDKDIDNINLKTLNEQKDNRVKSFIDRQKNKEDREEEKIDEAVNRRKNKKVEF